MSKTSLELHGRVVQRGTDRGVSDLRVVVADQETRVPSLILRSVTDQSGGFVIELSRDDAARLFGPGASQQSIWNAWAQLYISVYNGRSRLATTSQRVQLQDFAEGRLPELVFVDLGRTERLNFSIFGRVIDAGGVGQASVSVVIERADVGRRTALADGLTDAQGNFDLTYPGGETSTADATNLAIVVIVSEIRTGTEIARTPVIVDPDPRHEVDVLTTDIRDYRGQPEYVRVQSAITAERGSGALSSEDIALLVKRTGLPPAQVAMAIQAERISAARGIPREASYALMRSGLPADVPGQLGQTRQTIRDALQRALDENVVGATMADGNAFDVDALAALYTERRVEAVLSGTDPTISNLIATSGLASRVRDRFLALWVEHEGTGSEFWAGLETQSDFTPADIETLRFTTDATGIVNGFEPALRALQRERVAGNVTGLQELAGWDRSAWSRFVTAHGAPDTLPGLREERESLYAATLERVVEEQFPTQRVARRLAAAPMPGAIGVPEFIDANPAFDITRTVVAAYFEANPSAVPSGLDAATTEANLKRVQRVFTLTPRFHRYDVTRVLLDGGIDSAAQIVRTGKPGFVQRFGPRLEGVHDGMSGEAVAKAVYASALQKHGFSLALMAQYGASMNTVSIGAIQALKVDGSEGPGAATLASLFGSLDYCACEDCRSMFSPAAYLVDLLSMLEGADAYSAFHTRRGDIAHLELSCENTNTVLPYIDIVNEVLEDAALSPRARPNTRQTTWTETELRLNPEPTGNAAAYDGPAQAVFPWSLPVDVPAVETHAHLERLGFSRAEAMALFAEDASDRVISEDTRTAERLGMGTLEFELATAGPLTPGSVPGYERWGFGSSEEGTWAATLAGNLRRVLRVTALSFDELARLLTMRRIYRRLVPEPLEIGPPGDEPPTCDLDGLSIRGFDEAAADRIHRFLRIARRVDASWRELDIMLEAFGGMTASTLRAIADALEVRDSLGISLDEGIWADLDQHSYDGQPSVFARIFQSNQVLAAAAGEFSLGGSLDEAQHFSHLRSGLGINDSDLRLLLDAIGAGLRATLDIVLVSLLFGHARLARALGLRVPELLRYLELVEVDPFASPGDTLTFAEIVQTTEASGVGLDGVEYLCRHRFAPELGFHPTDSALDAVLADIAAGKADVDALLLVDGVPAEVLRAHAEALFGAAEAAIDMVRILSLEPIPPAGTTDGDRIRELLEGLVSNADPYLDALPGPSGDPLVFDERLAAVIPTLIERRRSSGYEATVLAQLAGFSSLSADTVAKLAMDHVAHPSGSAVSVFRVLVDGGNREALAVFHKAGMLVAGLGLEARDLDWIFASAGAMNLSALPVAATDAATARTLFTQWHDVRLWSELLGGLTSSSEGLQAISDGFPAPGDERNEQLDALASISGWNLLDIDWARGAGWLGLDGDGLRDPARMARLRDMGVAVRRTGVRAEQLAAWARNAPDDGMAKATKQALRARYTEQTWADVIRPISDRMRELRRDALLDYIIARGDFESPESVYAYYLLDPEMNACMQTSRLKLAISSVQLYVQRVLLRLEDGVSFSPGFTRDWEWRKNYRVWEANRKVFFYPENWIVPELRSDKTPFFRELEAHLQQGELTSDHVEQGFKLYLNKLHEVSNLAILDMHEVYEPDTRRNVVHVVGRTRSQPYHYFYRKKVGDTHWTPWEPADVGISGEHLLLRSFNHRLFLFWLEFIEAAKTKGSKGEETEPRLRFVLCYTERKNGGWAPKKSSKVASWKAPDMNRENYSLWGTLLQNGRSLRVEVVGDGKYRFFRFDPCQDEFVQAGSAPVMENLTGLATTETLDGISRAQRVDAREARFIVNEWSNSFQNANSFLALGKHQFDSNPTEFTITACHQDLGSRITIRPYAVEGPSGTVFLNAAPLIGQALGSAGPDWNEAQMLDPHPKVEIGAPLLDTVIELRRLNDDETDPPVQAENADGLTFSFVGTELIKAGETASRPTELRIPETVVSTGATFSSYAAISMASFSHPFTCDLLSALNITGVNGVLAPEAGGIRRQQAEYAIFARPNEQVEDSTRFQIVKATHFVRHPFPLAEFEFTAEGSYSQYNWEVFFHAPLMIASRLRSEGSYEEADGWYRFIFNPLNSEEGSITGPERFWMVKPLFQEARVGEPDVIQALFSTDGFGADPATLTSFVKSVARWLYEPFNPHAIASVRSGTYRWVAVRGYLDNLLDWADALFRRDSIESVNEATQLYLLAAELLGPKPERVQHSNVQVERYSTIDFPVLFGGLAEVEGFYPEQSSIGSLQIGDGPTIPVTPPEPPTYDTTLKASVGTVRPPISPGATDFARETREVPPYQPIGGFQQLPPSGPPAPLWWTFCLPPNPQLLAYWDTVADRLFKIRNCMNIEGVERSLALFEAPIDPALLVRARAAGVDLTSAIDGLNAPLPTHRYRVLVGRAIDLCNDVKALGGALLSALEKRDAEALSRLRSLHETSVLKRMRQVREWQVEEASDQIEVLKASDDIAGQRESYFTKLLDDGLLQAEVDQIEAIASARDARRAKRMFDQVSSVFAIYPNISIGTTGFSSSFGSTQLSAYFTFLGEALGGGAFEHDTNAQLAQIAAGYLRRDQDWRQQKRLATLEKVQINKQIIAAKIRKAIAKKERSNLERQIEQAEEIEAFYRDKFTSKELYDWMIGEISRLYFQAYKLAFDMAKKAERAMQFELETSDSFIEFGYWDGLKKGLMAGERLHLDIKRMESAYLDRDKREFELTKRVSLRQVDPIALQNLRQNGTCDFHLPEVVFDLDHPGHYLRRIRSVRLTIPAVAGPHTSIGATLTLQRDALRSQPSLDAEPRITYGGSQRIATSHAREDGGLFEVNFRDERYLPFEGAGVDSHWNLRLPSEIRQFDYNTISDVEIRIDYTARDGGTPFRQSMEAELRTQLNAALASASQQGLAFVLSAKKDFAVEWERFLRPNEGETGAPMVLPITLERFPYMLRGLEPTIQSVEVVLVGAGFSAGTGEAGIAADPAAGFEPMIGSDPGRFGRDGIVSPVTDAPWSLDLGDAVTIDDAALVDDLWVVARFTINAS